jgi:type II secretory pathway pseudopilin PulG
MRSFATRLAIIGIAGLLAAASIVPASAAARQKRAAPAQARSEQTARPPAAQAQPAPCLLDEGYGRLRSCASGGGGGM